MQAHLIMKIGKQTFAIVFFKIMINFNFSNGFCMEGTDCNAYVMT